MNYPSDNPQEVEWSQANPTRDEPREKSCWPTCLIGCLIVFLLMIVLAVIAAYFAFTRGPALLADFAREQITEGIEQSDLPVEEKQQVIHQVDRVADAVKSGELGMQDMERAMRELAESPLMTLIVLAGVRAKYLEPSGLSAEEKQDAERTVQRTWRGLTEKQIDKDRLEPTFEIIATKKGEDQWVLKNSVPDDELRRFFSECKQLADEAGVPNEDFDIRVGEEIKRIVDDVLGSEVAEAPDVVAPSG